MINNIMFIPLKYAWHNERGGRWVIFNYATRSLEIGLCSVSENQQSLPRPPTGIAILWVPPSISDDLAIQRAYHSDIYFALLRSIGVKHQLDDKLSIESTAKKLNTGDYISLQPKPDTCKKRRQE